MSEAASHISMDFPRLVQQAVGSSPDQNYAPNRLVAGRKKFAKKQKSLRNYFFKKKISEFFFDIFDIFVKNNFFEIFEKKNLKKKSNCPKIFVDPTYS